MQRLVRPQGCVPPFGTLQQHQGYLKFSVRQEHVGGMREGGPAPGDGEDALSP